MVDPFRVPLLKTIILLSSGVSITSAHFFLVKSTNCKDMKFGLFMLFLTVILGVVFLGLQLEEYIRRVLSFKSRVYGSTFFMLTGFHGLHVTIGAVALSVVFYRYIEKGFSSFDHVGFEGAA